MKELRKKIAGILYYYGALVQYVEEQEDLPPDVEAAIKNYYAVKDEVLDEITKDQS